MSSRSCFLFVFGVFCRGQEHRYDSIPWRKKTTLKLVPFDNEYVYQLADAAPSDPKASRARNVCFARFVVFERAHVCVCVCVWV